MKPERVDFFWRGRHLKDDDDNDPSAKEDCENGHRYDVWVTVEYVSEIDQIKGTAKVTKDGMQFTFQEGSSDGRFIEDRRTCVRFSNDLVREQIRLEHAKYISNHLIL